jgi:hypothetical protein
MNRSILERASWIAGIVSAVIAALVWFFPPSNSAEKSNRVLPSQSQTRDASSMGSSLPAVVPPGTPPASATPPTSADTCPTKQVIQDAQKQVGNLSTYGARDEAYSTLFGDALCIGDLELATQLAGQLSSYSGRDTLYGKVLDAAILSNKLELTEKLAGSMSSYNARDAARRKIIDALRGRG